MTKLIPRIESELNDTTGFHFDEPIVSFADAKELLALCKTLAEGLGDNPPQNHKDQYAWTIAKNAAEEAGL